MVRKSSITWQRTQALALLRTAHWQRIASSHDLHKYRDLLMPYVLNNGGVEDVARVLRLTGDECYPPNANLRMPGKTSFPSAVYHHLGSAST